MFGNNVKMLERSMDFLWAKQTAILDNISNAETPGYKTKTVTFEEAFAQKLQSAKQSGDVKKASGLIIDKMDWKVSESAESTRMDENSVNLTEQNVELVRNAYQLQYTMQAMSSDFAALRTAING